MLVLKYTYLPVVWDIREAGGGGGGHVGICVKRCLYHCFCSLFIEKYQVFIKIQDSNFIFLEVLYFHFSGRLSNKSTKPNN